MEIYKDLYQQLILDHNQNPKNFYILKDATHTANGFNPLCGDQIKIFLKINGNIIEKISFQGEGCAISKASASIMTTMLINKKINKAQNMFEIFHLLITQGKVDDKNNKLDKLIVLGGIYKYPSRVKCASLAWHTFQGALKESSELIKSE